MTAFGIDDAAFTFLLKKLSHKTKKRDTLMRQAIPSKLKLQVFLEYVATGCPMTSLDRLCHVSSSSISKFIPEVAEAICETLAEYIQPPSDENKWKQIADGFRARFGVDNCVGVLQGKTIYSKKWQRYAKETAVYLWFAADTQHRLVCVDIGTCPKEGMQFADTSIAGLVWEKSMGVPDDCYFIGPSGVQLHKCIMTPYVGQGVQCLLSNSEQIFNHKLAQIADIADNTFNSLRTHFKLIDSPLILAPETVAKLLKACFALHNWMQSISKQEVGCISEKVLYVEQLPNVTPAPGCGGFTSAPGSFGCAPGNDGFNCTPGRGVLGSAAPGSREFPSNSELIYNQNLAPGSRGFTSAPGSVASSCAPGSERLSSAPGSERLSSAPGSGGVSSSPGTFSMNLGYNEEAVLRRYELTEKFACEISNAHQFALAGW